MKIRIEPSIADKMITEADLAKWLEDLLEHPCLSRQSTCSPTLVAEEVSKLKVILYMATIKREWNNVVKGLVFPFDFAITDLAYSLISLDYLVKKSYTQFCILKQSPSSFVLLAQFLSMLISVGNCVSSKFSLSLIPVFKILLTALSKNFLFMLFVKLLIREPYPLPMLTPISGFGSSLVFPSLIRHKSII